MTTDEKQYQEIPVNDWRELKVGDTIKFDYMSNCGFYLKNGFSGVIKQTDWTDIRRPFELCEEVIDIDGQSFSWPFTHKLRNVRKLVEIPHQPTQQPQTMNYSQEILNVIKSKNAWVIAKVQPNGQLDFSIPQSMVNSEAEVKGKIEQLAKTYPGVIFTSFKMQHAVRVNQPELIVR